MLHPVVEKIKDDRPNRLKFEVLHLWFSQFHHLKVHSVHDDRAAGAERLANYFDWEIHRALFAFVNIACEYVPLDVVVGTETKSLKEHDWLSRVLLVRICVERTRLYIVSRLDDHMAAHIRTRALACTCLVFDRLFPGLYFSQVFLCFSCLKLLRVQVCPFIVIIYLADSYVGEPGFSLFLDDFAHLLDSTLGEGVSHLIKIDSDAHFFKLVVCIKTFVYEVIFQFGK